MTFKFNTCSHCLKLCNIMKTTGTRALSESTNTRKSSSETHYKYCMDLVRKHDYENFLCSLLYPSQLVPVSIAIQAFNVETAQIGDMQYSSDIKTGLMRMQFWKDSIEQIYKGSPPHTPTAIVLFQCIQRYKLSKHWFTRITDARFSQLSNDFYRSIQDMEDYAENTRSSILYLLLESAGIKDVKVDHVASHVGKTQGLVTLLRSLPYNTSKGKIYLPRESLLKHKVSGEDLLRGRKQKEVCDIVFDIATVANQHLEKARSLKKDVPNTALPFFLNTVVSDRYLKLLQKADFNVFHPSLQGKNRLLHLQLLLQKIRKKY